MALPDPERTIEQRMSPPSALDTPSVLQRFADISSDARYPTGVDREDEWHASHLATQQEAVTANVEKSFDAEMASQVASASARHDNRVAAVEGGLTVAGAPDPAGALAIVYRALHKLMYTIRRMFAWLKTET